MKRAMAVATIAALIGTSAWAADMAAKAPPPAPISATPWSWTGFYFGINGGGGWGTGADWNPLFASPTTGNFAMSGGVAGGQAGYNWQSGNWVLGIETDIDWSDVRGTSSSGICGLSVCTEKNTWIGTTRGRLGYAADHWLIYATGGVAYGAVNFTVTPFNSVNGTTTRTGGTVGGGVEYAFTHNVSAKAEYLYADLGTAGLPCTPGCGTSFQKFDVNILRGGLNWHF